MTHDINKPVSIITIICCSTASFAKQAAVKYMFSFPPSMFIVGRLGLIFLQLSHQCSPVEQPAPTLLGFQSLSPAHECTMTQAQTSQMNNLEKQVF